MHDDNNSTRDSLNWRRLIDLNTNTNNTIFREKMVTISSALILEKNSLYATLKKSPIIIKEIDDLDFIKK